MVLLIGIVVQVLAIIAMVRLWSSPHTFLWWSLLVLLVFDWLTAEAVKNAVKMGSGEKVENFWTVANMVVTFALLVLAVIGNVLA